MYYYDMWDLFKPKQKTTNEKPKSKVYTKREALLLVLHSYKVGRIGDEKAADLIELWKLRR